MAVNKVTNDNFQEKVLNSSKPVLVDFYADWCGPCKMLAPMVEEIASASDAYDVYKLNVDDAPDLAAHYGVMSIPTLIVFKNGAPFKSAYRRFAVKSFDGQDDYGSMREVISRRLNRYVEEKDTGEGFGRLPDLILLDGGQGQVNAVKPIVEAFGLDIPVFGMVKDGKHRTRAISAGGQEISVSSSRRVFTLISEIQQEVHRFAITYHKQKHTKRSISTTLTAIPGIGEKKARLLLKHFRSLKGVGEASEGELNEVSGISKSDAQRIYDYFHKIRD